MCTPECIIAMLGCPAFNDAVKAVIKAGKYASQYRMHVDNLGIELRRLRDASGIIERRVREARDRGEEIENAVAHWQADAGQMENDVQELVGQVEARMHCFACSCPNIKWRYRLSKQAEEKTRDVQRLVEYSHFEEISHPKPPPSELEFPSAENYVHLDSRTPIFEQIVVALKDPNVKMIGVHGLGGVGKTTLVEKVAKEMLHDGTFKQIPLATVSKVLNVMEIQKKLAGELNLLLDARADEKANKIKLCHKFNNGDKYLVILDDIWEMVDLKAIGIPITDGQTGCKVVLTSRTKDLLEISMKTDRNFPIVELEEGEAWDLFKNQVGNSMESQPGVESLAREVCKKCKGLPVAIKALGAALEGKPRYMWENALDKLKRYMLTNIEGISSSVWAILRVSYDMLESSDAKSCFLLCCLFAKDFEISIDDLTRHCVARSLLSQNPRTLEEARDAIRTVVYILKSTSLLSNGSNENVVRIHDVIRDVGISIAREEQAFLVDHGALQWPRNLVNEPSVISLNSGKIRVLPDGLVYPQLHTLILDNNKLSDLEVPDKFFSGMKQLTVLILIRIRMRRLPSSLAKLSNLRMLCLDECELADIAILGDLKTNLEVLSLRGSDIEALPPEMAQLTSLRVLDLRDCDDLKVIPQGIISNLTYLEELYFANTFDYWEEIRLLLSIGQLTTLHIHIPAVTLLPKEDLMLQNLKRFRISVGTKIWRYEYFPGTRALKYEESSLRKEFIPLLDKAEVLYLSGIKGLKKVLDYRGVGNEFLDLKYLKVESCDDDLEYLLGEPKSSVQSRGLYPFNHLTDLIVEKCKLKYLFSPTTARGLVHLEQLRVASCENIREIVGFERQNNENELIDEVKFSKLKRLELKYLPELKSFYAGKEKTQATTGSSSTLAQPLFNEKVILPILEELEVKALDSIEEIWDNQPPSVNQETASFSQLRDIRVDGCTKLMNLVPSNILPRLRNLQFLVVNDCPNVEFLVFKNKKGEEEVADDSTLIIPRLSYLGISRMERLKRFYSSSTTSNAQSLFNHQVAFPALEDIYISGVPMITGIWVGQPLSKPEKEVESFCKLKSITVKDCEQLEYVLPSYMLPQLHNLLELEIRDCKELEVIVSNKLKEKEATNNDILVFPQLKTLKLRSLDNLKCFCTGTDQVLFSHKVAFPALENISIWEVPMIRGIWVQQPLSKPETEVESFCKLKSITVGYCEQLEYVLLSYMLPQLHNLLRLEITDCKELEVIVSNKLKEKEATNNDILVFPQLKTLTLRELGNLKCFCTGTDQLLFSHKVAFPALEDIYISDMPMITGIWVQQPLSKPEKEVESFCKLKSIEVWLCDQLEYVLPSYMLPQLHNLLELKINYCREMEVIVSNKLKEKEATNNDILVFPQLKTLELEGLDNLKCFCTGTDQLLFSHKVTFPVLEELNISEVGNIIEIWDKLSITVFEAQGSFGQLMNMGLKHCNKLTHLFPSKMHPLLKNLKKLYVRKCATMEGIVGFEGDVDEDGLRNEQVFSKLTSLRLRCLPKLVSFCTKMGEAGTTEGNPTIHAQPLFNGKVAFPALEDLQIHYLINITEIWDKKPIPEPGEEIESFCKLATIDIWECDQLVYILPSYMLPRLQNLQKLEIWYCKEVEVIVSKELKEKEAADNDPIVFSQLKKVEFHGLPKLKSFYNGTQLIFSNKVAFPALEHLTITKVPKIKEIWDKQPLPEPEKKPKSFYKLTSVHVEGCNQLVYVFPSYMLPQLQNLEKLAIANCKEMEIIISNKLKEKFAKLKTMILQNLPNLKRLCAETQLGFSNKDAFPVLEINIKELTIERPGQLSYMETSCIAPNLMFLVNGTSTKEESGTSGKDEDSNDHDKEGEDGEEDVKNADDNKGVGGEEKDEDDQRKEEEEEETEDHISNLD